jgi:hypothetical protein
VKWYTVFARMRLGRLQEVGESKAGPAVLVTKHSGAGTPARISGIAEAEDRGLNTWMRVGLGTLAILQKRKSRGWRRRRDPGIASVVGNLARPSISEV